MEGIEIHGLRRIISGGSFILCVVVAFVVGKREAVKTQASLVFICSRSDSAGLSQ